MPRQSVLCGICLLLVASVALIGCERSSDRPGAKPVKEKDLVGTWHYAPPGSRPGAGAAAGGPETYTRELVINADGTYKMTVCDANFKPLARPQFVEGTWHAKGTEVYFEPTNTQLDEAHQGWGPYRYIAMGLKAKGHDMDFLEIRDEDSGRTVYTKLQPQ